MNTESIKIPIEASFDNKGVVDAEKAFGKFGTTINNTLKELGSDKSMEDLGKSVKTAFDMGLKGSTSLLKRFSQTRSQAVKSIQEAEKLTAALEAQKKVTDEVRERMSSVDNAGAQSAMKKLLSPEERKTFDKYQDVKRDSEYQNKRYEDFKKINQAALEGVELQKQLAGYRQMEKAYAKEEEAYKERVLKLTRAHAIQEKEFFKSYGVKDYRTMIKKGLDADVNGNPTQMAKEYQALRTRQSDETDNLRHAMPKTSEKLENLRSEFNRFAETYKTQIEQIDQSFGSKNTLEKIRSLQSWLGKLTAQRLETDMDGVKRLTSETVEEEQRLKLIADDSSNEFRTMREEVKEIFASHIEETDEVKEQVALERDKTQELEVQKGLIQANVRELENQGTAAQDAIASQSDVSDVGYDNSLKKVFSWQRIYTIIGKLVTNIGDKLQELGRSIANLLVNIGKLGVSLMTAFGSGVVKGVAAVGRTISTIKTNLKAMIPSAKKVMQFLVKYIFGFRTMYFLVRKVRQAIGDGFKAMAKVDPSVNKSISALQMALNQLKGQIGASFAPLLNVVAPVLVKIINLATQAMVQVGAFLATLTGQHTFKVAIAENVDYAASLDKTSKSAGKAAKAIRAYLSPLDELNRMDDPDKGSGGGGAGGIDPNDLKVKYKDVDVNTLGISDFAKKLKKAWEDQDWEGVGKVISDKLGEVSDKIASALSWDKIGSKINKITDIISGITNGISKNTGMWESLGKAVGEGFNTAIKTVNSLIGKIKWKDIGSGFATALGNAIKKIDPKDISKFLEDKITVVLGLLNGFMDKMKKDGTWTEIAKKVIQSINGVDWYTIAVETFTFAGNIISAIKDVLSGFISQGGFTSLVKQLASGINDSIGKLTSEDFADAGKKLSDALIVLLENVGTFLNSTKGSGDKLLEGIKTFIKSIDWKTVFTNAGDIASTLANGFIEIFGTIADILNEKDENGNSLAKAIGRTVGEALSKIDFKELTEGFMEFGEGIITGIIAAFSGAKPQEQLLEAIKGFFSADAPIVKGLAMAAPWMALVGAVISGIGKALPLVLSANNATGGKLGSMIASWFSGGGTATGTAVGGAAAGGAGKTAILSGAATGAGAGATVFGALGSAAVMAALAIQDVIDKQDAWAWGIEEIGKSDNPTMKALETIWGGIKSIPEALGDLVDSSVSGWKGFFEDLGKGEKSVGDFSTSAISAFGDMDGAFASAKENMGKAWDSMQKGFTDGVDSLKKTFSGLGSSLETTWENTKKAWNTGVDKMKEKLGSVSEKAKSAWEGVKSAFSPVADWFKDTFEKAWENVRDVFSTGGKIFSGIKEGIESTFKKVVNKIIDGLNTVITKPFNKINEVITTLRGIEVLGAKPFKSFKNFDVPKIPKLAQGAVIPASKPFIAMLGDQKSGNNLEAPESLIRQIVREEAGGNNGKTTVVAKVGRHELFEIVLEEAKIRQQTTGRNPFEFT